MGKDCLGVVAAMPQEIAPLLRRSKGYRKETAEGFSVYRFQAGETPVVLIESGMGPRHAAAATRMLISLAKPKLILNFGFAGAVLPGTAVGDLVLAEQVLLLEEGRLTAGPKPDPELCRRLSQACASAPLTLQLGNFITAAGIMNKEAVAASLGGGVAHPVLEMETAAVLLEAELAGIPVVAVRGVSDAADEELGFSIEEFCDAELRISLPRVLGCIARRPWIIPQLVRLSLNSNKAGKNLALCVELALQAFGSEGGARG
jgi:adenosylhomocysteine nucleosidase